MARRNGQAQTVNPSVRVGIKKRQRQAARQDAQAAVGKTPGELTAANVKALLVALLFKADALDENLAVRPLAEWLRDDE